MMEIYGKAIASIESTDDDKFGPNGGFTAVLSTPSLDRDGDRLHRDEWQEPMMDRYPLDIDHGMSVADTVGSFHPYFEGDNLMMDAYFASTGKAQEVRTLVKEGHVPFVSVAFMTDKSKKDNEPRRELLNAGIVAVPSNRDAVILASKAAHALKDALSDTIEGDVPEDVKAVVLEALSVKSPEPYGNVTYADPEDGKYPIDTVAHIRAALAYINVQKNYDALGAHAAHVKRAIEAAARSHGIDVADKSFDGELLVKAIADIWAKAGATASGIGGDGALVQAIHDASSHLGAACPIIEMTDENDGASDGANKSVDVEPVDEVPADEKSVEDEAVDDKLAAFEEGLAKALTPEDSVPEAPAPTVEVPAPASPADVSKARKRALDRNRLQMRVSLSNNLTKEEN